MAKKILGIGAVVLLVGALIGGGVYLLLRDSGDGGGGGHYRQSRAATTDRGRWSSGEQELAGGTGNGRASGGGDVLWSARRGNGYRGGNADAGAVENPSLDQGPALRNDRGRPSWSGRGRRGQ